MLGCALEIAGYCGRIMLWNDDFDKNAFIIYLIGLTIGPAFYSAAVYFCLSRIILVYGFAAARLNPRLVTIFFITGDVISLILQAIGGAMASIASTQPDVDTGVNIMIAGLSTQVASTTVFTVLCGLLAYFIIQNKRMLNPTTSRLRKSLKFRLFLFAIGASLILILVRCIFRVIELSDGFSGSLANNELFLTLFDCVPMSLVIILLTIAHPGIIFGEEIWREGAFRRLPRRMYSAVAQGKKTTEEDTELMAN